jgi:hypothetical protein
MDAAVCHDAVNIENKGFNLGKLGEAVGIHLKSRLHLQVIFSE